MDSKGIVFLAECELWRDDLVGGLFYEEETSTTK